MQKKHLLKPSTLSANDKMDGNSIDVTSPLVDIFDEYKKKLKRELVPDERISFSSSLLNTENINLLLSQTLEKETQITQQFISEYNRVASMKNFEILEYLLNKYPSQSDEEFQIRFDKIKISKEKHFTISVSNRNMKLQHAINYRDSIYHPFAYNVLGNILSDYVYDILNIMFRNLQ